MKQCTFHAIILKHPDLNAAYVECPFDATAFFGRKRIPVQAVFDGKIFYTGSLVKMSEKCHVLGITQAIRAKLGKSFGEQVEVQLTEDNSARTVQLPEDIQNYFSQNRQAEHTFEGWSFTRRKEAITAIETAKRPETREKRKQKLFRDLE